MTGSWDGTIKLWVRRMTVISQSFLTADCASPGLRHTQPPQCDQHPELLADACDITAEQISARAPFAATSLAATSATATAAAASTPGAPSQGSAAAPAAGKPHSLASVDEALVALALGVGLRARGASAQAIQHCQLGIALDRRVNLVGRELRVRWRVSRFEAQTRTGVRRSPCASRPSPSSRPRGACQTCPCWRC